MKKEAYPLKKMQESLRSLETEAHRLKELAKDIPGVEKNVDPIMAFIDILKFHLSDLRGDYS